MILEKYRVHQATICFLGSIVDVLNYYGIVITEEELLFLGCGVTFYCKPEISEKKLLSVSSVSLEKNFLQLDALLRTKGYGLRKECFNDFSEFYSFMHSCIDKLIPVIVKVDTFFLPYHIEYHKNHYGHVIVTYGVEDDDVYVSDSYITTLVGSCSQEKLSRSEFEKSIVSNASFNNSMISCIVIDKQIDIVDDTELVINTLIASKKNMFCKTHNSEYTGIEAMSVLAEKLESFGGEQMTSDLKCLLLNLYKQLTGFGGPAATRMLVGKFFEKNMKNIDISEAYYGIRNAWEKCSKTIYRSIVYEDTQYCKKAGRMVRDIIQKEKTEFEEILKIGV